MTKFDCLFEKCKLFFVGGSAGHVRAHMNFRVNRVHRVNRVNRNIYIYIHIYIHIYIVDLISRQQHSGLTPTLLDPGQVWRAGALEITRPA